MSDQTTRQPELVPQGVLIDRRAEVHVTAKLGPGTRVWQFASVLAGVTTGQGCSIGACAEVGMYARLGDNVRIGHGVFLPARATVGNRVFIGPNATFTDDRRPKANNPHYRAEPPFIEDDAAVGAGAVILPGVRLGRGCIIGAGAVVTKDVPSFETWVGQAARLRMVAP